MGRRVSATLLRLGLNKFWGASISKKKISYSQNFIQYIYITNVLKYFFKYLIDCNIQILSEKINVNVYYFFKNDKYNSLYPQQKLLTSAEKLAEKQNSLFKLFENSNQELTQIQFKKLGTQLRNFSSRLFPLYALKNVVKNKLYTLNFNEDIFNQDINLKVTKFNKNIISAKQMGKVSLVIANYIEREKIFLKRRKKLIYNYKVTKIYLLLAGYFRRLVRNKFKRYNYLKKSKNFKKPIKNLQRKETFIQIFEMLYYYYFFGYTTKIVFIKKVIEKFLTKKLNKPVYLVFYNINNVFFQNIMLQYFEKYLKRRYSQYQRKFKNFSLILRITVLSLYLNNAKLLNLLLKNEIINLQHRSQKNLLSFFDILCKEFLDKIDRGRYLLGIKLIIKGKLKTSFNRPDRTTIFKQKWGVFPLQTLGLDISYSFQPTYTPAGVLGIHLWLNKRRLLNDVKNYSFFFVNQIKNFIKK